MGIKTFLNKTRFVVQRIQAVYVRNITMSGGQDSYDVRIGKLLDEHTTSKYHIEYEGFKTNHLSQAVIALKDLKAPVTCVEQLIEWLKEEKLEDSSTYEQIEKRGPAPKDPSDVLGTRRAYYYLYNYYTNLLGNRYDGSTVKMIAGEFPKLSDGVLGAAAHGLIHLGYGFAARRDWFVCEGMAYLHDAYVQPIYSREMDVTSLGTGDMDILDVIQLVHDDADLISSMNQEANSGEYNADDLLFTRKQNSLLQKHADHLARYVYKIKFPSGLSGNQLSMDKVPDLSKWVIDCAIIVYTLSRNPNDFFLLHGVTSSWALSNILPVLADCKDVLRSVQGFLVTLLTVYLIQGSPALDISLLDKNDGMSYNWDDLIQKSIAHKDQEREHMYKLAQVCRSRSRENPDSSMESLYRLACHQCVSLPFVFGEGF